VLTFAREFLQRKHSPPQEEALVKIFGTDPKIFWPKSPRVIGLAWGMGSGKDFTIETGTVYCDYLCRCLAHPQRFFWGIEERRFIDILNFSFVNEDQAKQIFFDSMKAVLRSCRNPDTGGLWFEEQGLDLRDNGIGDIKEKIIVFPNGVRNRCIPATKSGFEGSPILMAVFDEPSRAAASVVENLAAHKLFIKVRTNSITRFGDMGKIAAFSYPESGEDDLIMELVEEAAANPGGSVWASRLPTYKVNPFRTYDDFAELRTKQPELYWTTIECQPPKSLTAFYRAHPEKIDASFQSRIKPVVQYDVYVRERDIPQSDGTVKKVQFTAIRLLSARGDKHVRSLGGDAGETGDSFAMAMSRSEATEKPMELLVEAETEVLVREPVTGAPTMQVVDGRRVQTVEQRVEEVRLERRTIDRMPIVDLIIEIKPIRVTLHEGERPMVCPIDFVSVKDFILELKRYFPNLNIARFEKWQAVQLMQELVAVGIDAQCVPFPNRTQVALYSQHRQLTYGEYILHTPNETAQRQFRELQDIQGVKVDHKPTGGKDVSDSIVLSVDGVLTVASAGSGKFFG
jgi:hypothetical protein